MWLGQIVLPTVEKQILQIDISQTDFLTPSGYPTFLIYNPLEVGRKVSIAPWRLQGRPL